MAIVPELIKQFDITFFWYNPNIAPDEEYKLRLDSAKKYAAELNIKFVEFSGAWQTDKKQCNYCYDKRIEKTASYAAENGFDYFSTSLLSSPYQNHQYVKDICYNKTGEKFYYIDGRKNYYTGKNAAKSKGYYIQKYCACLPSKIERGL
jgi:predicted adenine nucleotide alpha hydrolase (AANH) superfamily ATPase